MNRAVLKDRKSMLGFVAAIVLNAIAIFLAANGNSYWVALVVPALILVFVSTNRASKLYHQTSS